MSKATEKTDMIHVGEARLVESAQIRPAAMPSPDDMIAGATAEAGALAKVIERQKLYSTIQGQKHVKVEGWTTLAMMRGCMPREVSVAEVGDGRYVATVELVRVTDGLVLTRASAECGGPGEPTWQRRPPNARRSMAITRASGKVCRIGFSWVMSLAGYNVTPAEEMESMREHAGNGGTPAEPATAEQLAELEELVASLPGDKAAQARSSMSGSMSSARAASMIKRCKQISAESTHGEDND